jgi:hypothetical protein
MRRFLVPAFAAVVAFSSPELVVQAAETASTAIAATPEAAVLLPVKVLRSNDFKGFYALMPAADKAKAEAEWKKAQADAKSGAKAKDVDEINQFLAKLLAPDAVDQLTKENESRLAEFKPQEISQGLQMAAGFLPMLLSQPTPGQTPEQAKNKQALAGMLQGMLTDASGWILTAGLNDPKKLRAATEHLVAGAKQLGVKNVDDLQALSFEDFLGRLGPLVLEAKGAASVYDIGVDKFLDSVKAEAAPIAAGAADTQRTLTVGFTAFGKAYSFPVQVEKKDNAWIISPKNGEQLGAVKQIMGGGAPGLPGGQ